MGRRKKGLASVLTGRVIQVEYENNGAGPIYDSALIRVRMGKSKNTKEAETRLKELSRQIMRREVTIQVKPDEY